MGDEQLQREEDERYSKIDRVIDKADADASDADTDDQDPGRENRSESERSDAH
jgi:hypothetical protein